MEIRSQSQMPGPSMSYRSSHVGRIALVSIRQGRVRRVRAVGRQIVRTVSQRCRDDGSTVGCHEGSADDRTRCWCRRGSGGGRGERQEGEEADL